MLQQTMKPRHLQVGPVRTSGTDIRSRQTQLMALAGTIGTGWSPFSVSSRMRSRAFLPQASSSGRETPCISAVRAVC